MDRNKLIEDKAERVVLVSVISGTVTDRQVNEYLDELEFLAQTAGAVTLKKFTQKLPVINQKSYVGAGKLSEIKEYVIENEIDCVIFDDELSPSQLRNIELSLGVKILDRTNLILDIFV